MNETYILGGALIASGLYITYLHNVIRKYRYTLTLTNTALEAAFEYIMEAKADEDSDS